jgi:hypothetical protein
MMVDESLNKLNYFEDKRQAHSKKENWPQWISFVEEAGGRCIEWRLWKSAISEATFFFIPQHSYGI